MRPILFTVTTTLVFCQLLLSFYYSSQMFQENNLYSRHQKQLTILQIEYSSLFTKFAQLQSSANVTPVPNSVPIKKSFIIP